MLSHNVISFFALLGAAAAQISCSGTLSSPNPITSGVNVPGGASCTLTVNVTGSVTVGSGSSFTTSGLVLINGGVSATGATSINLGGTTTIQGGLMVTDANTVTIGSDVVAGSVSVTDVTTLTHSGTATGIGISGDGETSITGGKVLSGVSRGAGTGSVTICGADIFGGIAFVEATGSISMAAGAGCAPSELNGGILAEKGTGSVTVVGATTIATDVQIVEMVGNVVIQSTSVSDLSISGLDGDLTLSAMADSDTTVNGITGDIIVSNFGTMGDFALVSPGGSVSVSNSDFGFEGVSVLSAGGPVSFTNVANFSLTAEQNPSITLSGSSLRGGKFIGNTALTLNNNDFSTSLECVENGSVGGSGNTVPPSAVSSLGQCSAVV